MKRIAMAMLAVTVTWAWASPARAYVTAGSPEGSCCSDAEGEGSSHWSEGIGLEDGHWGCMHASHVAPGGKPVAATGAICKKGGNPLINKKGKAIGKKVAPAARVAPTAKVEPRTAVGGTAAAVAGVTAAGVGTVAGGGLPQNWTQNQCTGGAHPCIFSCTGWCNQCAHDDAHCAKATCACGGNIGDITSGFTP